MLTYSKKAQIGMMETIFIIIVFLIIILIAIFYYANFRSVSLKDTARDLNTQEQKVLLASIYAIPEIECEKDTCIDASKILALKTLANKNYYESLFGKKTIKVELLYPKKQEGECTIEKYKQKEFPDNCNIFTIYDTKKQEKIIISSPISIYFPSIEQYRIGKIIIEQ